MNIYKAFIYLNAKLGLTFPNLHWKNESNDRFKIKIEEEETSFKLILYKNEEIVKKSEMIETATFLKNPKH